jgi:transposase
LSATELQRSFNKLPRDKVDEFLQWNPRVKFHFTPTYSSWLNQVEIWFARLEREVIARGARLGAEADALDPSLLENGQAF